MTLYGVMEYGQNWYRYWPNRRQDITLINADLYSQYVLDHEEHTSVKFE